MAKTWNRLPSDIYGISHPVTAWCFDRAVTYFGTQLQEDLEEHNGIETSKEERKAKIAVERRLAEWLGDQAELPFEKRKFRDPVASLPRKEA
jgi:hypothetical protein